MMPYELNSVERVAAEIEKYGMVNAASLLRELKADNDRLTKENVKLSPIIPYVGKLSLDPIDVHMVSEMANYDQESESHSEIFRTEADEFWKDDKDCHERERCRVKMLALGFHMMERQ